LQEHDRAEIVACLGAFGFGVAFQFLEFANGVADEFFPVGTGFKPQRQLDHGLGFEFTRGYPIQHVAGMVFAVRSGGEFQNTGGIEAGKGFKRKRRTDVLRFIHNHNGTV